MPVPNNENRYDMLDDSARQEELRLKKIRQGIIEDTSNEEYLAEKKQKQEAPVTLSEKVSDFWYHYKWTCIIVGIAVISAIALTIQALSVTKYDTTVLLCTYGYYSEEVIQGVSDEFADYTPDINDNGKIDVGVFQANYSPSGLNDDFTGYQTSLMSRIMAEIASGENCIFIIDEEIMKSLVDKGVFVDLNELLSLGEDSAVYGVGINNANILTAEDFETKYNCKSCKKTFSEKLLVEGKCPTCKGEATKVSDIKNSCRLALRVYKEGTDKKLYDAQVEAVKKIYADSLAK